MAEILYPNARGELYHVKSHGVSVEVTNSWENAFTSFQELGRRLGFHNCSILAVRDKRDLSALETVS